MEQPEEYTFSDDANYFTSNRTSGTSGNIYVITFSAPILKNTLESIYIPGNKIEVWYKLAGLDEDFPIVSRIFYV